MAEAEQTRARGVERMHGDNRGCGVQGLLAIRRTLGLMQNLSCKGVWKSFQLSGLNVTESHAGSQME